MEKRKNLENKHESMFEILDLSSLRNITRRNSLEVNGRSNWRKSYIQTLEDTKSYNQLILEEDELFLLSPTEEQLKKYKIVKKDGDEDKKGDITGKKRKREKEEKDDDDDEEEEEEKDDDDKVEPNSKKLRSFTQERGKILAFLMRYFTQDNPEIQNVLGEMILEETNKEKVIENLLNFIENHFCKGENNEKALIVKLLKYYPNIPVERIIRIAEEKNLNEREKIESLKKLVGEYFFENIKEDLKKKSSSFFKELVEDENTLEEFQSKFLKDAKKLSEDFISEKKNDNDLITIELKRNEDSTFFKIHNTTKLRKVFNAYCKKKNICYGSVMFIFDGNRIDFESTPKEYKIEDRDVIDVYDRQTGGKPVILLYPPEETKVESVSVNLNTEKWLLHSVYPKRYSNIHSSDYKKTVVWNNLKVSKNGEIVFTEKSKNEKFRYLFWESKSNTKFDFNLKENCFLVSRNKIELFLLKYLRNENFKEFDIHDFITYWLDDLCEREYVLIQFMKKSDYEKLVNVEISPKPQKFKKVFMLFFGVDQEKDKISKKLKVVKWDESTVFGEKEKFLKDEFIAFEWGGMNLLFSEYIKTKSMI